MKQCLVSSAIRVAVIHKGSKTNEEIFYFIASLKNGDVYFEHPFSFQILCQCYIQVLEKEHRYVKITISDSPPVFKQYCKREGGSPHK